MKKLSVVTPFYNEADNLEVLLPELKKVLDGLDMSYECIFVDDGSTDKSYSVLTHSKKQFPSMKILQFRGNFGQTAALAAGFDHAEGDIIIAMDADLQNDPHDIPLFIKKIEEGYDIVSGWRKNRRDDFLTRVLPSVIANFLISKICNLRLHDYGCTLKAYRKDSIKNIKLYGEMHRFIPIYASWQGAKIGEIVVKHLPRKFGKSKYGMDRTIKVILDLIVLKFLEKYLKNPIYLFGGMGILSMFSGFVAFILMIYYKFFGHKSFIETPLPLAVVFFMILGINFILIGLLAELMMRTYYESQHKSVYHLKDSTE